MMNLLELKNINKKIIFFHILLALFCAPGFTQEYEYKTIIVTPGEEYTICPPEKGKDLLLTLKWVYSDGDVWDSPGCGYNNMCYTINQDPRKHDLLTNESISPFISKIEKEMLNIPYCIDGETFMYKEVSNGSGGIYTRNITLKGSVLRGEVEGALSDIYISVTQSRQKWTVFYCSVSDYPDRDILTIKLIWGNPGFAGEPELVDDNGDEILPGIVEPIGSNYTITPSKGVEIQSIWNSYSEPKFDISSAIATTKRYFDGTLDTSPSGTVIETIDPFDKGAYKTEEKTQPGYYTIEYTLIDECGRKNKIDDAAGFDVSFSCSNGAPTTIKLEAENDGFVYPPETELFSSNGVTVYSDSWMIEPGKNYFVTPTESPYLEEFFDYYDISFAGYGANLINYNQYSHRFDIDPSVKIGRFTFSPVFKYNTEFFEDCNPILPTTVVTVGGRDQLYYSDCLLTIPGDLLNDDNVKINKSENYNWIFDYFKWTFKSKEGVILEPGVILRNGAIIETVEPYIADDKDGNFNEDENFVHSVTYDEWGFVSSESRNYFDDLGSPMQSQSKNLSNNVVMATQTIIDYYGRPSLQTLAAPVRGAEFKEHPTCGYKYQVGGNMMFKYEPGFVKNEYGEYYSYKDFDENYADNADNNPVPVSNIEPGSLGWYYSDNNFERKRTQDIVVLNSTMKSDAEGARMEVQLKKGFKVNAGDNFSAHIDPTLPLEADEATPDAIKTTMAEDHVPTTIYPFTRSVYNEDGSNEVISTIPPGDYHQLYSGREGKIVTEGLTDSDKQNLIDYLKMRNQIIPSEFEVATNPLLASGYKKTTLDANGYSSVVYYDNAGKELIKWSPSADIMSYQFYNTLGQLVTSVSPNGIKDYNAGGDFNLIDKTSFKYNSSGFMIESESLDNGIAKFLYASDGRVRYSQNAEQAKSNSYSYSDYDRNGRVIESGVCNPSAGWEWGSTSMKESLNLFYSAGQCQGSKSDITQINYDLPFTGWESDQFFIRGKVSYTIRPEENIYNLYSYDDHGRVKSMYQAIGDEKFIQVHYLYDRKGGVSEIHYQPGDENPDEFYHYYYYNKDGQLLSVYTSTDYVGPINRENLATPMAQYEYYKHGPLKRKIIGEKLQGIDYVYNINGWLKSINNTNQGADPGGDGNTNSLNSDIFAMNLEYFSNDYHNRLTNIESIETGEDLYDGTISAMAWRTQKPEDAVDPSVGVTNDAEMFVYNYDSQYQLLTANYGVPDFDNHNFVEASNNAFDVEIGGYDANGNIGYIKRNNRQGGSLDNFTYTYDPIKPNQLKSVLNYGTYDYNSLGQLDYDNIKSTPHHYSYNTAGKVTGIFKDATKSEANKYVSYTYGPNGFRVKKENENEKLYYARDLSGKILSVYEIDPDTNYTQKEVPVYADSRVGVAYFDDADSPVYTFEMSNHLGNVTNTFEPEDQNWWAKNLVTGELYVDYEDNFSVKDIEANFTNFSGANTKIADAVATLKSGREAFAEIYSDANRDIQVQNIVAPIKYNFETTKNIGKVTWDLPDRALNFDGVKVDHAGNVSYTSRTGKCTNYLEGGMKIQDVITPISYGSEVGDVTAVLISNGTGGCMVVNMKSTIKAPEENEEISLEPLSFDLAAQQVKAIVTVDPVGNGTVSNVSRNFTDNAPKNTVLGTFTASKTYNNAIEQVTATIKSDGENIILSDVNSTIKSGTPEEFHLGKIQFVLPDNETQNTNIAVTGFTDYYPFGSPMDGRKATSGKHYRFGYQGQFAEIDEETATPDDPDTAEDEFSPGYNAFEARLYDSKIGRWTTIDPAGQFYSPYLGMGNNPILLADPNGEHTIVTANSNGTYNVVGGVINNDNGIYLYGACLGPSSLIGYSATPYSFYNDEGRGTWQGTINPNDQSGRNFLNGLLAKNPSVITYMFKARWQKPWDFKSTNGTSNVVYTSTTDFYRGMPIMGLSNGLPIFGSARDVGNIGAGLVAGLNGMGWSTARFGFDLYQGESEPLTTQYGERLGHNIGISIWSNLHPMAAPKVEVPSGPIGLGEL